MFRNVLVCSVLAAGVGAPAVYAQTPAPPAGHHHEPAASTGWQRMQDGAIYALFNHQGGDRGGTEFVLPNWWMGMASRGFGRHQLIFSGMFSLDPATVGRDGYRELFQVGEALDGKPLVDRQHPHDFIMQLAGSWQTTINERTTITVSGGPAGEPTLGPVAFMHRPSAAGLAFAPLGHHTFDSTHISFGAVTAAVERGPVVIEGSVFNGREPDEDRWDFDFGRLDSFAGRVWIRPSATVELQFSRGLLRDPELLAPGDVTRTTASVSWFHPRDADLTAVTAGVGVNEAHGTSRAGAFVEGTMERAGITLAGRLEHQQLEIESLLGHDHAHDDADAAATTPEGAVTALTIGAGRRLLRWRGFDGDLLAHATVYRVPAALRDTHGRRPVSFQIMVRLRLPTGPMGRMWNMRMSQPMRSHGGH